MKAEDSYDVLYKLEFVTIPQLVEDGDKITGYAIERITTLDELKMVDFDLMMDESNCAVPLMAFVL